MMKILTKNFVSCNNFYCTFVTYYECCYIYNPWPGKIYTSDSVAVRTG
jgi:hypothetical protein